MIRLILNRNMPIDVGITFMRRYQTHQMTGGGFSRNGHFYFQKLGGIGSFNKCSDID